MCVYLCVHAHIHTHARTLISMEKEGVKHSLLSETHLYTVFHVKNPDAHGERRGEEDMKGWR